MILPMLAKTSDPHSRADYLYELKLDGERAEGETNHTTHLQSRSGLDITALYPEVVIDSPARVITDGELTVLKDGVPCFALIQKRAHQQNPDRIARLARELPAVYYVFDILYVNGESVKAEPLIERKAILKSYVQETQHVRILPSVLGQGERLFEQAVESGFEGVMAKRADSPYLEGKRSGYWQKMKPTKHGEFWAVGLTYSDKRQFASIVVAEQTMGQLHYVSTVGSGFNHQELDHWANKPEAPQSVSVPSDVKVIRWIKPEPVKVSYFETTRDGHLRFPVLEG